MSEAGYVELPVIAWLSGHGSHTPGDKGLGWTYRDETAMNKRTSVVVDFFGVFAELAKTDRT